MTHDELLDRIAQKGLEPHGNVMPTHLVLALRAVVELHKPRVSTTTGESFCDWCAFLIDCQDCYIYTSVDIPYPCPTIQAIEKNLI